MARHFARKMIGPYFPYDHNRHGCHDINCKSCKNKKNSFIQKIRKKINKY
jgi:hypothetical protein